MVANTQTTTTDPSSSPSSPAPAIVLSAEERELFETLLSVVSLLFLSKSNNAQIIYIQMYHL